MSNGRFEIWFAAVLAGGCLAGSSCGNDTPALPPLSIGIELGNSAGDACQQRIVPSGMARCATYATRGAARNAYERGEVDFYVGSAAELLRSSRHGGRTPRVFAAWPIDAEPRIVVDEEIGALVELKGRVVALDPDEDGLPLLIAALAGVQLELADVRIEWCETVLFALALRRGDVQAAVWAGAAAPTLESERDLTPRPLKPCNYDLLIGSAELAQRRPADVERVVSAVAASTLSASALAQFKHAVQTLERGLVETGELIGPTGGADALIREPRLPLGRAASVPPAGQRSAP